MPYVSMHIDGQDVLEELDNEDLLREIGRRRTAGKWNGSAVDDDSEHWTPPGMADDLRTAFYARNASRFEAIIRALELRGEPPRHTAGLAA